MGFEYLATIFGLGFFTIILIGILVRYNLIKEAKEMAQEIIQNTNSQIEEFLSEQKRKLEELKQNKMDQLEKELIPKQEQIERLKLSIEDKEVHLKEDFRDWQSQYDKYWHSFKQRTATFEEKKQALNKKKEKFSETKVKYTEELKKIFKFNTQALKEEIKTRTIEKTKERLNKWAQDEEQNFQDRSEKEAKMKLHQALHRFQRPYCPEKGLSYVPFNNEATKNKIFGPDKKNIQLIEEFCGVDIIYREDMNSISVSGFDPVRRKLARVVVERLCKEKIINEKTIESTVQREKKRLFQNIHQDGIKLVKELKIPSFKPEIINTMGSLRYRYSFAQNQYFHCAEVGHLCGLLASETSESISDAKRAGLLHDIGKAMDHSIDGGHAVIGADFIEKHEEPKHIVHAVRAHHYDEPPETNLAFLVIAADALSGARPGARRSTADAYMKKMGQLEEIGNSFDGVIDTYIMRAGREIRLTIDNQKVPESEVVELSKKVVAKIEDECNYPGLIKVTIVRNTQAVAYAK